MEMIQNLFIYTQHVMCSAYKVQVNEQQQQKLLVFRNTPPHLLHAPLIFSLRVTASGQMSPSTKTTTTTTKNCHLSLSSPLPLPPIE